jgi:rubrerythrin
MINIKINEIIDFAIKEEIRFQKIYSDAAKRTENNALVSMLDELSAMEKSHEEKLKAFKSGEIGEIGNVKVQDLKISEYLSDTEIDDNSNIQDVIVYAMKSEKKANELYTKLSGLVNTHAEKELFLSLANEELAHKNQLEKMYEVNFMPEN